MTRFPAGSGSSRPRPGGRSDPPGGPELSPEEARRILDGDTKLLVERAEAVAAGLRDETSRSQLRRLYGEVKRIEMLWRGGRAEEAQHRFLLLKPRLHYQVARQSRLRGLQRTLEPAIDAVAGNRDRFQRFVDFFEAIVAYAR